MKSLKKEIERAKEEPRYRIIKTRRGRNPSSFEGTLVELTKYFSYTLEKGASWQNEKGNRKIDRKPKSIKSLVINLYHAANNATGDGDSGVDYEYVR